jgi:hypothetical protein
LSSWVTLLLAPPFWFVVQFVPVGAGAAGDDAVGAGAGGVLGAGLDDGADGLGPGLVDVPGDAEEDTRGRRLGRALGDGLDDDEDGPGSGLVDDAGPDCATQWSRTESAGHSGTLADTPVSFPDDRQA